MLTCQFALEFPRTSSNFLGIFLNLFLQVFIFLHTPKSSSWISIKFLGNICHNIIGSLSFVSCGCWKWKHSAEHNFISDVRLVKSHKTATQFSLMKNDSDASHSRWKIHGSWAAKLSWWIHFNCRTVFIVCESEFMSNCSFVAIKFTFSF